MRHHTLDVYGAELYCATTKREWAAMRRKMTWLDKTPESAGLASFAIWKPKGPGLAVPTLVLWIDAEAHTDPAELVDTCAHEASHAVSQLMEYIGHTPVGTDEPSAYLVGWLAKWLWVQAS